MVPGRLVFLCGLVLRAEDNLGSALGGGMDIRVHHFFGVAWKLDGSRHQRERQLLSADCPSSFCGCFLYRSNCGDGAPFAATGTEEGPRKIPSSQNDIQKPSGLASEAGVLLFGLNAKKMTFSANEDLVIDKRGRGIDAFAHRVGGNNLELLAIFDHGGGSASSGDVDMSVRSDG